MNAHDFDKALALLKSLGAPCDLPTRGGIDHAWRKCRHCLALETCDHQDIRELLRAFITDVESLRVRLTEAEGVLAPFAAFRLTPQIEALPDAWIWYATETADGRHELTLGALRRARKGLAEARSEAGPSPHEVKS